jgi:hypothetical protein
MDRSPMLTRTVELTRYICVYPLLRLIETGPTFVNMLSILLSTGVKKMT